MYIQDAKDSRYYWNQTKGCWTRPFYQPIEKYMIIPGLLLALVIYLSGNKIKIHFKEPEEYIPLQELNERLNQMRKIK